MCGTWTTQHTFPVRPLRTDGNHGAKSPTPSQLSNGTTVPCHLGGAMQFPKKPTQLGPSAPCQTARHATAPQSCKTHDSPEENLQS